MLYIVVPSKEELQSSAPVSLYSHATSIIKFNGLNFSDWCEQIRFHLGVLDLDLAFLSEKPAAITSASSDEDRSFYKAWERSNRLSLMFMRMTVANNIKSTIKNTEDAKEFMKSVEKCSQSESADKSLAGTLMSTLTNIKFDGSRTIHEHILEMTNLAASMLIQEEARLEKPIIHIANLMGHKGAGKKPGKKNGKGNHGQLKLDNVFAESLLTLHHNVGTKRGQTNESSAYLWHKRLEKSKGYRFYCPNHSTRIVETGNVRFIENDIISGSLEPQKVEIQEVRVEIASSITSSQVIVPVVVDSVDNPQEQQINGQTPHNDIITHEPSEFDLSIDNDPVSFSQAIKGDNSTKRLHAMKEELKSMNDNEVWELVELPKESKRVECKWVFKTKGDSNGNIE
ncbi:UBN2_2 domain-containing protein [Cucumis melo var. makuwa]|uniref:UBN2_2 domain-containing protein n=1 Tax=Cucumis melo var. makuwa TaxID=1194695 RepID=A0A5D3DQH7_CUCMM|nr:UBN2_2 domain-containing protein [Cucumis melo var. makuwa]